MRALMIGAEQKAKIAQVIDLARRNPINPRDILGLTGAALKAWKEFSMCFNVELPIGYLVTYTQEHQPPGLCHHISVSVDAPGRAPNPAAMAMICEEFGMHDAGEAILAMEARREPKSRDAIVGVYPEKFPGDHTAINIVSPVKASPATDAPRSPAPD